LRRTVILGVPFSGLTSQETLAYCERAIERRTQNIIVTANLDCVVRAMRDPILKRIMYDASLVTPDGMPLVWSGRTMRPPLTERVAGSDFIPVLMEQVARKGHSVYFLGGRAGVAQRAADRCKELYPGLRIAGTFSPPFGTVWEMDNQTIVEQINAVAPDILLVAFGNPKQEYWMAMNHRKLNVPIAIGVGATLDFLSGSVPRAPEWMKRTSTEWLFRMSLEPRRLGKRYAQDIWHGVMPLALQTALDVVMRFLTPRRKANDEATMQLKRMNVVSQDGPLDILVVQGCHKHDLALVASKLSEYSCDAIIVDLRRCAHLDSEALSALVAIDRQMRKQSKHCRVVTGVISRQILRIARLHDVLAVEASLDDALDSLQFMGKHPLRIEEKDVHEGMRLIALHGELTNFTAPMLDSIEFGANDGRLVVFDLRGLRSLDTGGLQHLLERWIEHRGMELIQCIMTNTFIASILNAAGLREHFRVHSAPEAVPGFTADTLPLVRRYQLQSAANGG
jgi:N-acetylglucosaminyldiphosphoundecaprenol N-acetyl-beta-D-mannosaminyltransferase